MLSHKVVLRIRRNVASSGYSWTDEDFYQDEIGRANVNDNQGFKVAEAQSGARTLFLTDDNYKNIEIDFIMNRPGTLQKLKNLRDWRSDSGRLLVYPSFDENPSMYFDCILKPGDIPDHLFLKGFQKASDVLKVSFLEFQKNVPIVE